MMSAYSIFKKLPRLDIAVLGYALFLVINASSLWGGVFPFFPEDFHTFDVTFAFMQAQSMASLLLYVAAVLSAYYAPQILKRPLHIAGSVPVAVGGVLLIAALYLPEWRIALVSIAGFAIGGGSALLSLIWARYFSSITMDHGNFFLLCGTVGAPVIFFGLYLVPIAVRVFLMPIIFVPLCGLSVLLSFRGVSKESPIYQDEPAKHIHVYRHFFSTYWRSALAIGALGFASGLTRAAALSDFAMSDVTNIASMLGSLVSAGLVLIIWRNHSFAMNFNSVYKFSFPLFAVLLAAIPFLSEDSIFLVAGTLYMLFSLAIMVLMLQSAQASRNRGSNPFLVYAFFGSIVGLLQNTGFILGFTIEQSGLMHNNNHFAISTLGLVVLSLVLYLYFSGFESGKAKPLPQDDVEFIALSKGPVYHMPLTLPVLAESDIIETDVVAIFDLSTPSSSECEPKDSTPATQPSKAETLRDKIAQRCATLKDQYRLTSREAEVMEYIVRGYSVARIAETFVVSENTVRTHYKHIYSKLGIHKRQELVEMIEQLD